MASPKVTLVSILLCFCLLNSVLSMAIPPDMDYEENEIKMDDDSDEMFGGRKDTDVDEGLKDDDKKTEDADKEYEDLEDLIKKVELDAEESATEKDKLDEKVVDFSEMDISKEDDDKEEEFVDPISKKEVTEEEIDSKGDKDIKDLEEPDDVPEKPKKHGFFKHYYLKAKNFAKGIGKKIGFL